MMLFLLQWAYNLYRLVPDGEFSSSAHSILNWKFFYYHYHVVFIFSLFSGVIWFNGETFYIEPLAESDQDHLVFRAENVMREKPIFSEYFKGHFLLLSFPILHKSCSNSLNLVSTGVHPCFCSWGALDSAPLQECRPSEGPRFKTVLSLSCMSFYVHENNCDTKIKQWNTCDTVLKPQNHDSSGCVSNRTLKILVLQFLGMLMHPWHSSLRLTVYHPFYRGNLTTQGLTGRLLLWFWMQCYSFYQIKKKIISCLNWMPSNCVKIWWWTDLMYLMNSMFR